MATPDVVGVGKSLIPKFSANYILYFIIAIVVLGLLGWGFYWLFKRAKYNITFVIYQDISGKPSVVDRCKGLQLTHGKTGEKVFYIKKYNKYLPIGNLQMGIRTYYYYIDKAGHWHNFDIEHIDIGRRTPQLNMQEGMDYARDGINKRLEDRHNKQGFWEKWGMVLVSATVIAIVLIFLWLIIKDSLQNNKESLANLQVSQKIQLELTDKYTGLLSSLDNVCTGRNIAPTPTGGGG